MIESGGKTTLASALEEIIVRLVDRCAGRPAVYVPLGAPEGDSRYRLTLSALMEALTKMFPAEAIRETIDRLAMEGRLRLVPRIDSARALGDVDLVPLDWSDEPPYTVR